MKPTEHNVFVYGTLKPGGRYWPEFCAGKVDEAVPAKVRGKLYDLHVGYPGLRLSGEGWVQGYVLHFRHEADFLRLDELEGYHPHRPYHENEYIRLKVAAFTPEGKSMGEVWAYEITEGMLEQLKGTRIPAGDWPVRS